MPVNTEQDSDTAVIDLSSYGCPLHYIKARNALRQYQQGDVITFIFASDDNARQASSSLESDGHQILGIKESGITTSVSIRKVG